MRTLYY